MPEQKNIFKKSHGIALYDILTIYRIYIMIMISIPALTLDILITLNLLLTIPIYFIVLCSRRITKFSFLPIVILGSSVLGLMINIYAAWLILIRGAFFDGWLIRTVAFAVAGHGESTRLIIGFAGFVAFAAVMVFMIGRETTHISEVAAWFARDILPGKQLFIDFGQNSGVLTEEEAIMRKKVLQRDSDFAIGLDDAGKFIHGNAKICCFITVVTILGGSAIDVLVRGEALADAVKTYAILSIGSGALFLSHIVILSIATGWGIGRASELED
jgi:flagellar biosynthesis protein FlhA